MDLINYFKSRAREKRKKIVLPEGNETRIIKAAAIILKEGLADLFILGKVEEIRSIADKEGLNIEGAVLIDPTQSDLLSEFTDVYFTLRQRKGITREEASSQVVNPLYFGTLLVHTGRADGMVAGSINATADVLRPAFQIIKTSPGINVVSGAFIIKVPDCHYGHDGIFVFADCAVNPVPDAEQLADIAIITAKTTKNLLNIEPIVALLSFSTKGSAEHELVEKVRQATEIARKRSPELAIDGELQLDAALVSSVARTKCPDSKIAGKANVLVFPDLQSGNIGYKLVQRLAKAETTGPILQGIAKPINDLSRGCSVDDIVNLVAITSVQS